MMEKDTTNTLVHSRRSFLQLGIGAAAALAAPIAMAKRPERILSLQSLHTGERIRTTYWSEGSYHPQALIEINQLLRDHRSGEAYPIDPKLLDMLSLLHDTVGGQQAFQVISGYRSPASNAKLRNKSNGVARRSLHMRGKAIDIRLPGIELRDLRQAALKLRAGGVGYYAKDNFIHIDTGRFRTW